MALSIKKIKNYKKWGWDAWVMKNDLITLAVVPAIGGRIMEYALGKHSLLYVNQDQLGKIYKPASDVDWPNFGGYKIWPSPQKVWDWPPPPNLDYGLYEAEIENETDESVTLLLKSPVEEWKTAGIRIERLITVKHDSTDIHLKETLINESDGDVALGVWDITQHIVNHPNKKDYQKFWAYFPLNPKSRYGKTGVYFTEASEAWKGEVNDGVYGVQCHLDGQKIYSDCHEGWIAYTDHQTQLVMTKIFPNFHGKSYPENDARVAVCTNPKPAYLNVEVMGPIADLAPGESHSFSVDWGIAHASAPVLDVSDHGLVSEHLTLNNGKLTGKYGVFKAGSLMMVFRDMRGVMLKKTLPQPVSPLKPAIIDQSVKLDTDVRLIEVQINGPDGHTLGVLDSLEVAPTI